ncbi:MAG: TlyA family RNA methyltransferase [Selenomonadaceae bacterium]|nr:TlyA family RNA methyltransferase [Selenomonadaceae bacterium]MBQ9498212.1 TlyA family RNA methyltransferase [Selenomonadaceae bacterium]
MKRRLDIFLTEKNFFDSRTRAQAMIMAGKILVNGQKVDKAGALISDDAEIRILGEEMPFVSRGGLKLQKALDVFKINLNGRIAADVGASTGGFTDCMLQRGAKRVYAIDVGYGQLAWKLRSDLRVVNMERTNIRNVTRKDFFYEVPDFASIDVAFISLEKVLPVVFDVLTDYGEVVALIKPQFEAGREHVGKKGVVRDKKIHAAVVEKVLNFAAGVGFAVRGLNFSPVKGPEGNIEYLTHLAKNFSAADVEILSTVESAHAALD